MDALFSPLGINLFQLLVGSACVGAVGWILGAAWGGDRRDELDALYAGRDIQGEARAGLIDRRRCQRCGPIV